MCADDQVCGDVEVWDIGLACFAGSLDRERAVGPMEAEVSMACLWIGQVVC